MGLVFPENIGEHLSIDETSLSDGEVYTIITNIQAKGKKDSIVAVLQGTRSEEIIPVLQKLPKRLRNRVKEITLDLAGNMALIAKKCFTNAIQVIGRFHVHLLSSEALQERRIKHRWQAIDDESQAIEQARKDKENFNPEILAKWADKVERANFKSFNVVSKTINTHHVNILNYFNNKSTRLAVPSLVVRLGAWIS